jgi:hypothetical protein
MRSSSAKQVTGVRKLLMRVPLPWLVAGVFAVPVLIMVGSGLHLPSRAEKLANCQKSCHPRGGKLVPAKEYPSTMRAPGRDQQANFCECI